jgi:DNA-binding PadR family transcriptional regulator
MYSIIKPRRKGSDEMEEKDNLLDSYIQELRRGTLVLSVLSQLKNEEYGYTLSTKLKDKGLDIEQNTLYPLLRRLETRNLLVSIWKLEEARQRRYYKLSPAGLEMLEKLTDEWSKVVSITEKLLSEQEDKNGLN